MADASCPGIISNPDLVGIGTRLNFSVTMILAAIIPPNEYTIELLDELYMNAVFYSHALLITVLVQTIQGRLDLYHAIFVIHILFNLSAYQSYGIAIFTGPNWQRYSLRLKITLAFQLVQLLCIFPAWALYVWTKGSGFGAQPECNHLVKFVFFFVTIRATVNWLRIMFIVFFSLAISSSVTALFSIIEGLLRESRFGSSALAIQNLVFRAQDRNFVTPSSTLLAVYAIVTAELMVHRNRSHVHAGENSWGLGQVISVLLLLPIFIELIAVLKEWYSRRSRGRIAWRRQAEETKEQAEGQAEEREEERAEGFPMELAEPDVAKDIVYTSMSDSKV
ncbi:hypothetical protein V8E53_010054 [Lactarius tabidus]